MNIRDYDGIAAHAAEQTMEQYLKNGKEISRKALPVDGDMAETTRKTGSETVKKSVKRS